MSVLGITSNKVCKMLMVIDDNKEDADNNDTAVFIHTMNK